MSDQTEVAVAGFVPDLARYEQLMGVVRQRLTSRQFNSARYLSRASRSGGWWSAPARNRPLHPANA